MSEELLINVTPPETRVALIENGVVHEILIERTANRGLVGNIYKGKVCRVLPGMQAAFVDAGLARAAFLHAADISSSGQEQTENITALVRDGSFVVVQVVKDPLGTKGARLTTNISIPSRYMVYMPNISTIGISQKIEDEAERSRLKGILRHFAEECGLKGGFIARTASEGISEEALKNDMLFLQKVWVSIEEKSNNTNSIQLLHEDLPLATRALRDLVGSQVEKIRIDSRSSWEHTVQFAQKFHPEIIPALEYYPGERPIFDLYNVEDEIQKALSRKVDLKSGGHLIIDQTEAMTTIDVNTGAFVGHHTLEETIFKTNLEAAQSICRQRRCRALGGIIIIDFIDMAEDEHKRQVMRALERCLERDHARTSVCEVSSLGLVEMTRKRTRESLGHVLCEHCPTCNGRGYIKTAETACFEVFREILREARQFEAQSLLVLASQEVVDHLLDEASEDLAELEQFIGKPIRLQAETLYTPEQYDVVLV